MVLNSVSWAQRLPQHLVLSFKLKSLIVYVNIILEPVSIRKPALIFLWIIELYQLLPLKQLAEVAQNV